jgi:multiple sugar transport system ATP-binding protein
MAEIAFEGVSKTYSDGTLAVRNVSLEIDDGGFLVLVGPSGCGKTTLLRMAAGLEVVTGGAIRLGGRVINDLPPKDRDMAMVFQNYALYPHMSAHENMGFALKLRRLPKQQIDSSVRNTAAILGLTEQLTKKPGQLSGGQRQRVAMGRAIVREPKAFLMDEPLSNLDAKLRVQMRAEIGRLQRDLGVTTIYVTHDQVEAMTLGDRVAVMRGGVLQQYDVPQQLFERPANLFVAGFMGSPPMNLVQATLRRADAGALLILGSHHLPLREELFAHRPGLARYIDQVVALGIRPEDIDEVRDDSQGPSEACLDVEVELRETLGREAYLHFEIDAPPIMSGDVRDLAASADPAAVDDLEREATARVTRLIAVVDAHARAREGERASLSVDTTALHFFDPQTGLAIT